MVDAQLAIQKAVVAALKGHTDAGTAVYDDVPESDPFPRITIGPAQALPNMADCMDGTETFFQVDVWTRNSPGMVVAKTIAGQVRDLLHQADLTLDGHDLQLIEISNAQFLRDPDGLTKHAALTFRVLTQPS